MNTTRVIFRIDTAGDVAAVLPDVLCDIAGRFITCYAHVGQHGGCSYEWYARTKPATPEQYAALLAELRQIYETGDEPVKLLIRKRINQKRQSK